MTEPAKRKAVTLTVGGLSFYKNAFNELQSPVRNDSTRFSFECESTQPVKSESITSYVRTESNGVALDLKIVTKNKGIRTTLVSPDGNSRAV